MEQHKHCRICRKPIPLEEDFCSEECRERYEEMVSKRRKKMYIIYALLGVFFVVMFLTLSGYW